MKVQQEADKNPELNARLENALSRLKLFRQEVSYRILGQEDMVNGVLMGLLAGGHVLIEGVPGLAKTLLVRTVAEVMGIEFKRIQFTPDLLPADIVGNMVYQAHRGSFATYQGPIFSNLVLADEINRAPAKVQSALLEAMEERQVTLGESTHDLPKPFYVLATQNPIEQEGTYSLPEAQQDRFLMKLKVSYPKPEDEVSLLKTYAQEGQVRNIRVGRVMDAYVLESIQQLIQEIHVDHRIVLYIVSLVAATREKDVRNFPFARFIEYGASPRASLSLLQCARVKALFEGRLFVLPEDVKAVALDVLRHRIIPSYEAEVEELDSDKILHMLLSNIAVP